MAEQKKIRAIIYGLGSAGIGIAELALKKGIEIVAAVDKDEKKKGVDLGRFLGLGRELGVKISNRLEKTNADIVLHSTSSLLADAENEIIDCLKAGHNIISACEELVYPINKNYRIAVEIDKVAQKNNVSVIGVSSSHVFALDLLPIFLSLACHEIQKITVVSTIDPLTRSFEFQQLSGAGLTKEEFKEKLEKGELKNLGLPESIAMVSNALGIDIDKIKEKIEPITTDVEILTDEIVIKKGFVVGKEQMAIASKDGEEKIVLVLKIQVNARETGEEITIEGMPNINLRADDGLNSSVGAAGIVVNLVDKIINAKPGLRYLNELVPHY